MFDRTRRRYPTLWVTTTGVSVGPSQTSIFGDFVADEFGRSMGSLGYHYDGLASTKEIRNGKNAPIYRLAFFSKHSLGEDFWEKCKKAANPNRYLF